MEKRYRFITYKADKSGTLIPVESMVSESDLNEDQKNLLLGDALKQYQDLPEELKIRFVKEIHNDTILPS